MLQARACRRLCWQLNALGPPRLSTIVGLLDHAMHVFRLLFILGALSGLEASSLGDTNGPVPLLSRRIAVADRIIATNWTAVQFGEPGFGFLITGDKVKRIVKAVSEAKHYANQEHPDWEWDWQLRFCNGTNLLAAVCFARFADTSKAEAREWLKSPLHTILGEDNKKVLKYVNEFYAAGARKVFIADIRKQANGKNLPTENAKYLCVVLPSATKARSRVFRVHWRAVHEWGFDADDDVGQKYTWYPIDWHDLK